ncbi:hypothetical protein BJ741DRAFT_99293 [Chytriomyces cf. hyalinus JEL632]|nr:hypothetical protein BJ741DRAFT_99293 [Chytriomyces cf. hyalinus JEL632]
MAPEPDNAQTLLLSHGIIMVFLWVILAPVGVLAARYMQYNVNGPLWFQIHSSIFSLTLVLHFVAVALAFLARNEVLWNRVHPVLGFILTTILLVQASLGITIQSVSPPTTTHSHEPINPRTPLAQPTLNKIHGFMGGNLLAPLALLNVTLGMYMFFWYFPQPHATETVVWVVYVSWVVLLVRGFAFLDGWRYGVYSQTQESGDAGATGGQRNEDDENTPLIFERVVVHDNNARGMNAQQEGPGRRDGFVEEIPASNQKTTSLLREGAKTKTQSATFLDSLDMSAAGSTRVVGDGVQYERVATDSGPAEPSTRSC